MSNKERLKYKADPNKMYIALKVGWGDSVTDIIEFTNGFVKRDGKGGLVYPNEKEEYFETLEINDVVMKNIVTNEIEIAKTYE